ncbi:MAG: GNAT family N-acetyltransferase [Micrococcales bacterium]|nr:GNAT family N-acetyltransferase [Micrococcales bacterium]
MTALGWPATLRERSVVLRPIRRRDARALAALREANSAWLGPWEATYPEGSGYSGWGGFSQDGVAVTRDDAVARFRQFARDLLRAARAGESFPWLVEHEGELVGQMTVSVIGRGPMCAGAAGYWIDQGHAGRGITPLALAMAFDHVVNDGGLHRVEAAIRPENAASLRVVAKLGFRDEGMRPGYIHVGGHWADHRIFALNAEEVPGGLVARLRRAPS